MFVMRLAGQESQLAVELNDVLAATEDGADVAAAANDTDLRREWVEALPEVRAGVLMSAAWAARPGVLPAVDADDYIDADDYDEAFAAHGYAAELHGYAREFDDDAGSEKFHGPGFPAPPLPGPAGALATSVAFDRDELAVSLRTCLLLIHTAQSATAPEGGDD